MIVPVPGNEFRHALHARRSRRESGVALDRRYVGGGFRYVARLYQQQVLVRRPSGSVDDHDSDCAGQNHLDKLFDADIEGIGLGINQARLSA